MADRVIEPLAQPGPLRQQVHERLEQLIIYGELRPGERLVETHLASQLGVSRIPVREALQLLHRDGLVDLRPRQGAYVHVPTLTEVAEVFGARELVEVGAARLAAELASDETVTGLRALIERGNAAVAAGGPRDLVEANEAFHVGVARVAGNRVLGEILGVLRKRVQWYFATVVDTRSPHSWLEHGEILEAIAAKDPEHAAEAMHRHVQETWVAYREQREHEAAQAEDATPDDDGGGEASTDEAV
jgi:DNA-binding GntR family transcriptional regulator